MWLLLFLLPASCFAAGAWNTNVWPSTNHFRGQSIETNLFTKRIEMNFTMTSELKTSVPPVIVSATFIASGDTGNIDPFFMIPIIREQILRAPINRTSARCSCSTSRRARACV